MTNETIFLMPKTPGAIVRFPNSPQRILQATGEAVRRSPFWIRRLKGGDVVVGENDKQENQEETK